MATKLIKKEELTNWEYGDVCIKTFSFGDKLKLGGFATKVEYNNGNPTVSEKDINIADINVYALAAGIQYIKLSDNVGFFIKPNTMTDEKVKLIYNFEFDPAKKLLEEVSAFNSGLSDEQKKL